MGGSRKKWVVAAAVAAGLLGLLANGGSAARSQTAPVNTAVPTISGSPDVGATLTGSPGGWSGWGIHFSYAWLRCDSAGSNCGPIDGSTGTTYTLASADLGATLRFTVFAANRRGSTSATSDPTGVVTQPAGGGGGQGGPAAPTGLTATNPTQTGMTLTWTAAPDGTDPVAGYNVYVNGTFVSHGTGTSADVGGLTCGTSYTFAVESYDAAGNKSAQDSTSGSTSACPPPPTSSSIYWGAWIEGKDTYSSLYGGTWGNAPWDSNTWNKYKGNTGKAPSIVHWGVGTPWGHNFSYWASTLDIAQKAGALNLLDIDTGSVALSSIASGSQDSAIKTWAQQAASYGHPFFLRLDWEMNGGWFSWGTTPSNQNTPADYVAAWRHIHDLFTAAGAGNVTWVWCPNLEGGSSVPYSKLYPGDGYVDWTCLDGYNQGASSTSFSSLYSKSYTDLLAVAPSKPVMIGEIGSYEYGSGDKGRWISDMLNVLPTSFPKIKALCWFNWRINEGGTWKNWEIESSASSQNSFATGIGAPYYAAASSFAMPASHQAIQPLP